MTLDTVVVDGAVDASVKVGDAAFPYDTQALRRSDDVFAVSRMHTVTYAGRCFGLRAFPCGIVCNTQINF